MLPAGSYRYLVYNKSGVQLDFSGNSANEKAWVEFKRKIIHPSYGIWDPEDDDPTTHNAATDLADGSVEALTTISSEDQVFADGQFHVETDNASADGNVYLGIECSPDGGTWPSASTDWNPDTDMQQVASITLGGAESITVDFHL